MHADTYKGLERGGDAQDLVASRRKPLPLMNINGLIKVIKVASDVEEKFITMNKD